MERWKEKSSRIKPSDIPEESEPMSSIAMGEMEE